MLIERYKPYFYNANFSEDASEAGWSAFRGELVLQDGEVADTQGRRKPPSELLKEAVVLTHNEQLKLIAGMFERLESVPILFERYAADIGAHTLAIFYTVNINAAFIIEHGGAQLVFIPLVQGMIWNELMDITSLDKSDIKKLSAADKVLAVYQELKNNVFKYPVSDLALELSRTNQAKREVNGSV
jgi:hypothetical protein